MEDLTLDVIDSEETETLKSLNRGAVRIFETLYFMSPFRKI